MCYSAQIVTAFHRFEAVWNTGMSIDEFARLYGFRLTDKRIKIPGYARKPEFGFGQGDDNTDR